MASGQLRDNVVVTHIGPSRGMRGVDFRELWQYRDMLYFFVWKSIKVRYAQSVIGIGWALIQPITSMIVFTVVFGHLAKISSDGVPYAIFSYTALVPWSYFSSALTVSSGSLLSGSGMFTKVYYPRLMIPLTPLLAKLFDFGIAFLMVFGLMAWFRIAPTIWMLMVPVLILIMMLTAAGLGMWLTALAIQYRDIKYGLSFAVRLLMFGSPVVYPASLVPEQYRLLYAINPMVGVIEGFRSALLGTNPMPWDLIGIGSITAFVALVSGVVYFRRMERIFADVV